MSNNGWPQGVNIPNRPPSFKRSNMSIFETRLLILLENYAVINIYIFSAMFLVFILLHRKTMKEIIGEKKEI